MSDINAPMQYTDPADPASGREGGMALLVLLAVGLAIGAVSLAMMSREEAEPFVLMILAGLSMIGVFALFAGAAGILRFGQAAAPNDITKSLVDSLPQGALVTTSRGKIVYANEAYSRLVGMDDNGGMLNIERAFADNPQASEKIFRLARAVRQGGTHEEEFTYNRGKAKDDEGSGKWYRVMVRQIPAQSGGIARSALTLWLLEDITRERGNADSAFDSLQRMVDYLDEAPAGFLTADKAGNVSYMNATLARWLGRDLSEVSDGDLNLKDIVFGDTTKLFKATPGKDGKSSRQELETDLVRRDGTSFTSHVLFRPDIHQDAETGLTHMIVLNRTVSSSSDDDSLAERARFSRMFHATPIAIASIDSRGRIGDTNRAFVNMFSSDGEGYTPGETKLSKLVSESDRKELSRALDVARLNPEQSAPVELAFGEGGLRSGRFYFGSTNAGDEDASSIIMHAIEMTEQRELEVQFAQSQKMQAVGQLAGGIAHDFNNVLTAIIGFSELLLANHRPTDPSFQDIMNIKQNANRAAGLVRQLLAFSRQQTLRPEVLSLNDVLADLTILLGRLLGEKTELKLEHGRDLWLVRADLHQFEQVIMNLAVNARDAMPDGGKLTIRTANVTERESEQLNYKGMEPGEYVMCEVTDTGTGMPPEVMAKIFEPFFTTKEVNKGTGLGLSTVYGIIKQTGGYVYPESEGDGKGTRFRIFLPRHFADESLDVAESEDDTEQASAATSSSGDLTGSETILLVEDEEAVRSFAARALEGRGYKVLQAGTGAEALEIMAEHDGEVDLVVSDVVMPEMDGPTLLNKLRETIPDIKIIFISGYAEEAFKKNLEGAEDFAFLPKPFSLKQLAAAVKDVFGD